MTGHLPNLSGDVPRHQQSTWDKPHTPGAEPFEAETILSREDEFEEDDEDDYQPLGDEESQRRHERLVAPPCRPVPIQLQQQDGSPLTDWFFADILDISLGGLCLLITENHALETGHGVLVHFKSIPNSNQHRVQSLLRWFVRSGGVTTMGLGFVEPLKELPELELLPERRRKPRLPR